MLRITSGTGMQKGSVAVRKVFECANVASQMNDCAVAEGSIEVYAGFLWGDNGPPQIWGFRIGDRYVNLADPSVCGSPGHAILSQAEFVGKSVVREPSEAVYFYNVRSPHIGARTSLWMLQRAEALYGAHLANRETQLVRALSRKLVTEGASADGIRFCGVVEVLRYEVNAQAMVRAYELVRRCDAVQSATLPIMTYMPHGELVDAIDSAPHDFKQLSRTSLREIAIVIGHIAFPKLWHPPECNENLKRFAQGDLQALPEEETESAICQGGTWKELMSLFCAVP